MHTKSLQLCLTLCNLMDSSWPGSSVHGIFQARILEWVAISFSRGSSPPRDQTCVSCIASRFFTSWAIEEALNSILKGRDITLPTKVRLVKAMVFPGVMCGCESWTIKKAEGQRIDAFELWCWRRLLRVPWTTRRSNQSILKEIGPEYSLKDWCWSWNSNTLATWFEELTHWKTPWCWERLKAGGEGTTEDEMVRWHHWLDGHEFEQVLGVGDRQGGLACYSPWGHKESGMTEWPNWTELNWKVSELVHRILMYPFPASPRDDILHTHSVLSIIKTLFDFTIFHRHQLCVCVSIRFHQMHLNKCVWAPP